MPMLDIPSSGQSVNVPLTQPWPPDSFIQTNHSFGGIHFFSHGHSSQSIHSSLSTISLLGSYTLDYYTPHLITPGPNIRQLETVLMFQSLLESFKPAYHPF